jgi:hypothetical protein
MKFSRFVLPLLILSLCACQPVVLTPSVGDVQTAIAQTEAAQPSHTPAITKMPKASATPAHTPTATHVSPIAAAINVASQNLREGPSTLFDIIQTYDQGISVSATGRSEDSRWVQVTIRDEDGEIESGWMAAEFLSAEKDLKTLSVVEFPDEQTIRGRAEDAEGAPIPGVSVAAILRKGELEERGESISGEDGSFLIYFPEDLSGTFDVQVVGVDCTSPIVDGLCNLSEYFKLRGRAFITIPQQEDLVFVYQKADFFQEGTVVNNLEEPVKDIIVLAVRDDSAEASVRTDINGIFKLPLSEGIWEIYTVTLNPRREGEPVTVEITDQEPGPIQLLAPK